MREAKRRGVEAVKKRTDRCRANHFALTTTIGPLRMAGKNELEGRASPVAPQEGPPRRR